MVNLTLAHLQAFLYILMREVVPPGTVAKIIREHLVASDEDEYVYTNPHLAAMALDYAEAIISGELEYHQAIEVVVPNEYDCIYDSTKYYKISIEKQKDNWDSYKTRTIRWLMKDQSCDLSTALSLWDTATGAGQVVLYHRLEEQYVDAFHYAREDQGLPLKIERTS